MLEGPFAAILQEDLVDTVGAEIARAAAGDPRARDVVECAIRTKSGKYRDVRWQLAYAPSTADDEVVLFAIGQDLTEELALKEKTVKHEKLAAVGTLAAGLAHEIRNPLNGAQLHVSFLERAIKKRGGEPEMLPRRSTSSATRSSDWRRSSPEFLDFARPQPPSSNRPLRAPSASASFISSRRRPRKRTPRSSSTSRAATRSSTSIPAKMEQVLLNLVANAIEALAAQGGGRVTLRVRRLPRDVFFEVEDTGPGLPSPGAPIFDPFFSTKVNGTGLGLAISHRIVSDHGGDLVVESRPGRTVFRATLPLEME